MRLTKRDLLYWGGVLALMCLPVLSVGDRIGMYFDSVFPDYAATQILDPQEFQVKWFVAFPYLCQLYHGTVGVWISALGILVTGTTSILQHHIINIILEFIALLLMDRILSYYNVSALLRKSILVLLAISPTVSTIAMTQYYIELPGVISIFSGVLVYEVIAKLDDSVKQKCGLFFSFFLTGIAFYSYFNYLFFIIGFALYIILDKRIIYNIRTKLLLIGYGCLAGAVGYFAGYTQFVINKVKHFDSDVMSIVMLVLIWALCGIMLWLIAMGKERTAYICTGIILLIGIVIILLCSKFFLSSVDSLNIGGYYSAGLWERIRVVFDNYCWAMTGKAAESLILHETVSVDWKIIAYAFGIVLIVFLVLSVISKNIINRINAYIGVGVIYLMCCIPFATRMQTQHFIPLVFWSFIILGMMLQYIVNFVRDHGIVSIGSLVITRVPIILIFIVSGSILLNNRFRVIDRIIETGGRGYYTNQVNHLAYSALENRKLGENEIYIFPEWGFMTEFDYLTGNDIAFTTDCRAEAIESFLKKGYEVNIIYWYDDTGENASNYAELVDGSDVKESVENYYNNEGEIVFSDLVISLVK